MAALLKAIRTPGISQSARTSRTISRSTESFHKYRTRNRSSQHRTPNCLLATLLAYVFRRKLTSLPYGIKPCVAQGTFGRLVAFFSVSAAAGQVHLSVERPYYCNSAVPPTRARIHTHHECSPCLCIQEGGDESKCPYLQMKKKFGMN